MASSSVPPRQTKSRARYPRAATHGSRTWSAVRPGRQCRQRTCSNRRHFAAIGANAGPISKICCDRSMKKGAFLVWLFLASPIRASFALGLRAKQTAGANAQRPRGDRGCNPRPNVVLSWPGCQRRLIPRALRSPRAGRFFSVLSRKSVLKSPHRARVTPGPDPTQLRAIF